MKHLLWLLAIPLAHAAPSPREICLDAQLETLNDEAPLVRKTYSRDIEAMTEAQVQALATPIKQHVIIVAKGAFLDGYPPDDPTQFSRVSDISNTLLAVEYLRQINEQRDEEILYTYYLAPNGIRFTKVTYYPGVEVGSIFLKGSNTIVARISDQYVECVP